MRQFLHSSRASSWAQVWPWLHTGTSNWKWGFPSFELDDFVLEIRLKIERNGLDIVAWICGFITLLTYTTIKIVIRIQIMGTKILNEFLILWQWCQNCTDVNERLKFQTKKIKLITVAHATRHVSIEMMP